MHESLSRRERQIMDRVYFRGRATAEDIREDLGKDLSNSAVRTMLSILEDKGFLRHETEGKRFVYLPTLSKEKAGADALKRVLGTFFGDSASNAVAALIESKDGGLPESEYERLAALIDAARGKRG